jgi:hypothetical protein
MSLIKPPSVVERISGSLAIEAVLTAVAAGAGTPLAALLPVLGKSLAAERHKLRVEATLRDINDVLASHEAQLRSLTDQQYKFINETVLALLHTTSEEKMALLRNAVQNGLAAVELPSQEAVFLSRIIRDISFEEANFLLQNFNYKRIWLNETALDGDGSNTLVIKPNTPEGRVVLGLIMLGLVTTAEPTWDESGHLKFSPFVAKLIALLEAPRT